MQRNAVVTGCSVGLGRATALGLARGGWRVFAGVRSGADAGALLKEDVGSGRIELVQLDVRDRTAIEAARAYVAPRIADEGRLSRSGMSQ